MRKKDRLEKKRKKRQQRHVDKVFRKAEQRGALRAFAELASVFIFEKMKQQSFIGAILSRVYVPVPPFVAVTVDATNVVHWSTLVDKGSGTPREQWPRITLCDANLDRAQASCQFTRQMVSCVECLAREGT